MIFNKELKEYNRQRKKKLEHEFFCSKTCFLKHSIDFLAIKFPKSKKHCEKCGQEFLCSFQDKDKRRFCSKECSLSERHRIQKEIAASKPYKARTRKHCIKRKLLEFNCCICNCKFSKLHIPSNKPIKTCSKECRSRLQSNIAKSNPNCGGQTNYKKYVYNDISMDSSWEVELAFG